MRPHTNEEWAHDEFAHAALPDLRLKRRLCAIAASILARPGSKMTQVLSTSAEREAAYRFMKNESVESKEIGLASTVATLRRAGQQALLYVPIDGTSLNFTDRKDSKGLGIIGARNKGAHGINVMSAIGVDQNGVPLGLLEQAYWTRVQRSTAPAEPAPDRRPVEEKETRHWLDTMSAVRAHRDEHAPGLQLWFQLDRGADANVVLREAIGSDDWLTVRSSVERRIRSTDDEPRYLQETLLEAEPVGEYTLRLKGTTRRKKRTAQIVVSYINVDLRVSAARPRDVFLPCSAVLAREVGEVPDGDKPLHWMLLTTRPVSSIDDAMSVLQGYAFRWRCEEFHRAWKSGCCDIESSQLSSVERIERLARIAAAVALRVISLAYSARFVRDDSAAGHFHPTELMALRLSALKYRWVRSAPNITELTVAQAVDWLARLGGYVGRPSGGPPGQITIRRGLERLEFLVEGLAMFQQGE